MSVIDLDTLAPLSIANALFLLSKYIGTTKVSPESYLKSLLIFHQLV